jgi:uncharacterized membrane protein YhaH (DUF805 family)
MNKETRTKGFILIIGGLLFMLYMVLPISNKQFFMQSLMIGGFLYIPFYFVLLFFLTGSLAIKSRRQSAKNT